MPSQIQVLAYAVYELRLLLAAHLGSGPSDEPAVRAAAHLAYALHNQALAALEGRSFDAAEAVGAIANVDKLLSEHFVDRLSEATKRAV